MIRTALMIFALTASSAAAETVIEKGAHFVIHRDYHHKTNTFSEGAPEGTETACFRVNRVDLAGKEIDVELVSGSYTPWWTDGEALKPGFKDTYGPADAFVKNNPNADWTELLKTLWKTVETCPKMDT